MHRLFEVDGVQDFDPVRFINDLAILVLHGLTVLAQLGRTPLEHLAALHKDSPLWIGDYIGTVHLHKVWLQPEAGLQFVIIRQLFICLSGAFTHFQRYVNSYPA